MSDAFDLPGVHDRLLVRPGPPLSGSVAVQGAKNSALKLMAASLLAEGTSTIGNVPRITDVDIMASVLGALGARCAVDGNTVTVERPAELVPETPYELMELMRASIVVLGPLLACCGEARVALPGGDDFGPRPIDMHVRGLEALGAEFELEGGSLVGRAEHLTGAEVTLELPSVGATENLLLAAVKAKGTTVIDNAAREPEITDLAAFLNRMGAQVLGAGTSTITVEGVESLTPAEHTVVPDRVEAATLLGCVGAAGGEVVLEGARPDHLTMVMQKLGEMGVRSSADAAGMWVARTSPLRSVDIATLPYPGVATDFQPLFMALLSVADGVGIVTENLFGARRFGYIDDLIRMGADIRTEGHHAVVRGVPRLSSAPVRMRDIRAGAALVVAALAADGETVVSGLHHLDRGYEALEEKLRALGADVERVRG